MRSGSLHPQSHKPDLNPQPKSFWLLFCKTEALRGVVDAFNLTDSHTARMSMAPIATDLAYPPTRHPH